MKKVLVYGAYDLDNLGDDFMMHQIDKKLKNNGIMPIYRSSVNKVNYFNIKEEETLQFPRSKSKIRLCIKTLKWMFKKKDISDIDALICMGGGYTNEKFGLQNLLRLYCLIFKFKRSKKKIYFTGQTVGPAKKRIYSSMIKKIYSSAQRVCVREQYSKQFLESLNIKCELVGDDAFLSLENISKEDNNTEKEYAIFNYKDFKNYGNFQKEYFDFLLKMSKIMNKKIIVIPFKSNENSNEYKINYKLYKYLVDNEIDAEFVVERNMVKFCDIFLKSKFVVGTAYHSIVLGLIFGNTVFSTYAGEYYKMKIKGILGWYGIENSNSIDMPEIEKNGEKFVESIKEEKVCEEQSMITKNIFYNVSKAWNSIIKEIREEK